MNNGSSITCALILMASTAAPTAAQSSSEPSENVTVFAPYVVKKAGTAGVQTVTMSRNVNFHDLDLTKDGDVTAFEQRVRQAADDVCQELDRRFRSGTWTRVPQDSDCAKNASASALVEVKMVVATVRAK